jgi:tRNA A37 N6-isopentenylltransferase MiaA
MKLSLLLVLNKRLDDRVDQMLSNGLFDEINEFKKEFENKFNGQVIF